MVEKIPKQSEAASQPITFRAILPITRKLTTSSRAVLALEQKILRQFLDF